MKTSETLLESLEDQLMEARSQVPAGILEDELTSQEILEKRLIDQSKGQGLRQLKGIMVRRTRGELALLVDTWRSTLNIENAAKQARTEAREQRSFHLARVRFRVMVRPSTLISTQTPIALLPS